MKQLVDLDHVSSDLQHILTTNPPELIFIYFILFFFSLEDFYLATWLYDIYACNHLKYRWSNSVHKSLSSSIISIMHTDELKIFWKWLKI